MSEQRENPHLELFCIGGQALLVVLDKHRGLKFMYSELKYGALVTRCWALANAEAVFLRDFLNIVLPEETCASPNNPKPQQLLETSESETRSEQKMEGSG